MSASSLRRFGALLLLLPTLASAAPTLRVEAGHSLATPAPGITAAGYLRIVNAGGDDRLLSAESPRAKRVEIHEMRTDGGMMRMRALSDGLPVPAGKTVELAPGGLHLMLLDPPTALAAGESVPLTLVFQRAGRVSTTLDVRSRDADDHAGHAHH